MGLNVEVFKKLSILIFKFKYFELLEIVLIYLNYIYDRINIIRL